MRRRPRTRLQTPVDDRHDRTSLVLVDGGDRACGELLLVLAGRMRGMPGGTTVRLVATDPAAVVDLPAWCHLTGHDFLGQGRQPDGRAHYDLHTSATPRVTRSRQPWRLHSSTSPTSTHGKDPQP